MSVASRLKLYKEYEEIRKIPLIVYATSRRSGINAMMAGDALDEFIDLINLLPQNTDEVDILVESSINSHR